ncbi:hypothetical protein VFES401_11290 [Aliivibrio fischeri]|uniref:hypothetical protein n=1 Tax=Aliivibrio fischeri TaxID=668 RepID=UPI0007C49897|nr:hypothetical protein [Aliivibrio fischeri]TGA70294.1 hypothetical protein VFES401_11290 [Aliivibrio fischeri]
MEKISKLILIPILLVAGVVHATTGRNFNIDTNMEFSGKITRMKRAAWSWQIPSEIKDFAYFQDIVVGDYNDSADGLYRVYNIGASDQVFSLLEGYMAGPATGGSGIVPRVELGRAGDLKVQVLPGFLKGVDAKASVNNESSSKAILTFDFNTVVSVIKKDALTNNVYWFYSDNALVGANHISLARKALDIITNYNTTVGVDFPNIPTNGSPMDVFNLMDTYPTNFDDILVAGWYTQISNIKLVVPKAYHHPLGYKVWNATIGLVVKQL